MAFLFKTLLLPVSSGLRQLMQDVDRPDVALRYWPEEFSPLQGSYSVDADDSTAVSVTPLGDLYDFTQPRAIYGNREMYSFQLVVDKDALTRLRAFLDPIGTLSTIIGTFPGARAQKWRQTTVAKYTHIRGEHWRVSVNLKETKNPGGPEPLDQPFEPVKAVV